MSYALNKLGLAVGCLKRPGPQRDNLAVAIAAHLACIRIKDLPVACRADFAALLDRLCMGRILEQNTSVRQMLDMMEDSEVTAMAATIVSLYDAVVHSQVTSATAGEH